MRKLLFIFIIILCIGLATSAYGEEQGYWQSTEEVSFSGGTRTVNAVHINLEDKTIRMEAVLAKGQIGQVAALRSMAESLADEDKEVIAAINGTFFNAYSDLQPHGTIRTKGKLVHMGNKSATIGFTGDNRAIIENLNITIKGSINGSWDYPNNWEAWGFNHIYESQDAIVVMTPEFGLDTGDHNKTSIVVDNGEVSSIVKGKAPIPKEGFTIVMGNEDMAKRFKVQDKVSYRLEFSKYTTEGTWADDVTSEWENVRTSIGAGPALVKDGVIVDNGEKEGFQEDKINTDRGQRSFIGVNHEKILVMGTVPNVTVLELAEIVKNMGLVDAMNLDGGASAGLLYKGSYLTEPTRDISNSLVVTKLRNQLIRIKLNGREVFYDTDPYIAVPQNRTMVPMRGIFEALGATITWNPSDQTIIAQKREKTIQLKSGSDVIRVNGVEEKLEVPVTIKNSRAHVPLRFVTEALGGTVEWDGNNNIVTINLADGTYELFEQAISAEKAGEINEAKELYLSVIEKDSRHISAILNLAKLYSKTNDYEDAAKFYQKYLDINPDDISVKSSLGWAYYNAQDMDRAQEVFKALTVETPNSVEAWMALGSVYSSYSVKEYEQAKECYDKALSLGPTDIQKELIENQLKYIKKQQEE